MTGSLVRRMRVRGKSSYDREGYDQHAVWIPLPHFFLQTSPPSLPGNSTGRPCFVISVWLFGTSSMLVPGRAHMQCRGVLHYCEPLMWHSSGVASSIPGKGCYEHTRLPYVLCSRRAMIVYLRLLTAQT